MNEDCLVSSSQESHSESKGFLVEKCDNHKVDSSGIESLCTGQSRVMSIHPRSNKFEMKVDIDKCLDMDVGTKLTKAFPWITDFSHLCQQELGLNNIDSLENLMTQYIKLVSAEALECHKKPNRAAKLKKAMNNTLLLFHLFYSDIKKPLEHSSYLDKMSDLMAVYIDMEITASSRCKETLLIIASKLTTSLFIFLDRSHDHILDSIFKTKYMKKTNWELCNLIFTRVLRESPGRAICDLTYVRYLLAFKMWKRLVNDVNEKKNITKLATMKLHPPPLFRESVRAEIFSRILPKFSKSKDDITKIIMTTNFCAKERIKEFLKETCYGNKRSASMSNYMSTFDSAPFSSSNDTDDSRISSEEDQENSRGGSSVLINNIWLNMSLSSDSEKMRMAKQSKMRNSTKQNASLNKTKCKGIATPVFKQPNTQVAQTRPHSPQVSSQTNTQSACDSVERLRNKRRLEQISEMTAIRPLPSVSTATQSNVTAVKPRIEEPNDKNLMTVDNIETCQSSSSVKKEFVNSENSLESIETVNDGPSRDKVLSLSSVPAWNTGTTKSGCDAGRISSHNQDDNKSKLITVAQLKESLHKVSQSSQTEYKQAEFQDLKQEFINKTVEKIEETGRSFHKNLTARPKPWSSNSSDTCDSNMKPETNNEKWSQEKRTLHDKTLTSDYIVFTSQQKFRSHILNNSLLPESESVPSPSENDDNCKRCTCLQCSANHTALVTNYNALTEFLKSKRTAAEASGSTNLDKIQDTDPSASCLPFKKRRQTTVKDKEEEELTGESKMSLGMKDDELSYPSTPMISIAMIEPKVQTFVSSDTSSHCLFPPSTDYTAPLSLPLPSTSQTTISQYDIQAQSYILSSPNNQQILLQSDNNNILLQSDNNILLQSDPHILIQSDSNPHILLQSDPPILIQSDLNNSHLLLQSDVNDQPLILQSDHTTYHQVVLQPDNQIILQSDLPVSSLQPKPLKSSNTFSNTFKTPEYKPKFKTPAQLKQPPIQTLENKFTDTTETKIQKKTKSKVKVERTLRNRK